MKIHSKNKIKVLLRESQESAKEIHLGLKKKIHSRLNKKIHLHLANKIIPLEPNKVAWRIPSKLKLIIPKEINSKLMKSYKFLNLLQKKLSIISVKEDLSSRFQVQLPLLLTNQNKILDKV